MSASCETRLILSPALVSKAIVSTEPEELKAALPEGVKLQGKQESHALARCKLADEERDAGEDSHSNGPCEPSIHIACSGNFSVKVESWIESLSRRKQISPMT